MKFWDREREVDYLKRYLQSEPNAILFVYGPKSRGNEISREMPNGSGGIFTAALGEGLKEAADEDGDG